MGKISNDIIKKALGSETRIISANKPLITSPLEALTAKTKIPKEMTPSRGMRISYLLDAMIEAIKLTCYLHENENLFPQPQENPLFLSNNIEAELTILKTSFVRENDGIKISCCAEQDGKRVGEISMKFP